MFNSTSLNRISVPKILIILISGLLFNGCAIYYPQTTDIPLINEKNELRIDGGISLIPVPMTNRSLLPGINGTVSYGLTDKIAVQVSGTLLPTAAYYNPTSQSLINGAVGLYKHNPTTNWTKELYVGIGNGYSTIYSYDDYHSGSLIGNYQLYFVQGNIGRRSFKLKFFEFAFGLKLGLINSHVFVHDVYGIGPIHNDLGAFIEPAISVKLGGKRLMLNIKPTYCYVRKIIKTDFHFEGPYQYSDDYKYSHLPFGIGLSLNYRFSK